MNDFHLLSLIYTRDVAKLEYFLADVSNVKRLRRRALRLGGWRLLNPLEKGILNTVVNVLTRVRSSLLLKVISDIIIKMADYLLTSFEKSLLKYYYMLKETLSKHSTSPLSTSLLNDEYLINQAWKMAVAESAGMDILPIYSR